MIGIKHVQPLSIPDKHFCANLIELYFVNQINMYLVPNVTKDEEQYKKLKCPNIRRNPYMWDTNMNGLFKIIISSQEMLPIIRQFSFIWVFPSVIAKCIFPHCNGYQIYTSVYTSIDLFAKLAKSSTEPLFIVIPYDLSSMALNIQFCYMNLFTFVSF